MMQAPILITLKACITIQSEALSLYLKGYCLYYHAAKYFRTPYYPVCNPAPAPTHTSPYSLLRPLSSSRPEPHYQTFIKTTFHDSRKLHIYGPRLLDQLSFYRQELDDMKVLVAQYAL